MEKNGGVLGGLNCWFYGKSVLGDLVIEAGDGVDAVMFWWCFCIAVVVLLLLWWHRVANVAAGIW